ncbi:hypothetical protein GTO91_11320 [Heliobacterium undosum]|uniref:HPt domain-containing protein n=1 Tax=Heliomicrobium undosum TaxID=121734 RepID=A0A845L6K7_9FIRM|nr:Hpt domain-containing protein [Heliomicrobium undosum]MZP30300.1 hypothetical protein [Heliomicrobium undosum]
MNLNSQYDFYAVFFDESLEMLAAAGAALLAAEETGQPSRAVPEVFRAFHSIKGGAQSLDLDDLARFAHRMEDWLDPFRRGKPAGTAMVNILLDAMDRMEAGLTGLRSGDLDIDWAEEQRRYLQTLEATDEGFAEEVAAGHGSGFEEKAAGQDGRAVNPAAAGPSVIEDSAAKAITPANPPGSRLLCLRISLNVDAPMPDVRHFLVQERLKQAGRILDSRRGEGPDHPLILVVTTDQSDEAIRQNCDVGDVEKVALTPVNDRLFSGADALIAEAGFGGIGVALIDISEREILEPADLRRLSEARSALAREGKQLGLITDGPYTRRHLNILEAAAPVTGELPVYRSHFEARCDRPERKNRSEGRTGDVPGNESAAH